MNCYYCDLITAADPAYRPRPAGFDTGSEAPGHFMSRFYCPQSDQLLCQQSGDIEMVEGDFWAWPYWWVLPCPNCGQRHPSLDHAEFTGEHPWQANQEAAAARRWLSAETQLTRYPPRRFPQFPPESVSDADAGANWSANAEVWDAGYDERGDFNRKYLSDPVFLAFLGDVRGQRVLDAGSGNGYLSRLLARQGARMVAVENAQRFHELALRYQSQEPLAIKFHRASISAMPFLADATFDAAVANYVLIDVPDYESAISEIARVLKPGGRFVFTAMHATLNFAWHIPALDSPRREDRTAWKDDDYFIRQAGYVQWGALKPVLSFHRPLRDYVAACKRHGLELRDLEEPEPSAEAERELPRHRVRDNRRVPVSYVLKCIKRA